MSGFFTSADEAVALETPPVRIFSLPGAAPLPSAQASPLTAVTHRFGNPALNSRLSVALPDGTWKLRWQTDLQSGLNPAAVLSGPNRLLVWGWQGWQLFEPDGKALANGLLDSSDVFLDPQDSVLYAVDNMGRFSARRADNGDRSFALDGPSVRRFQVAFIARHQQYLIVSGVARLPQPHAVVKPHTSVLQSHSLSPGAAMLERELMRDAPQVLTAMSRDTVMIAASNHVYLLGTDLNIRAAMEGDFEPLAMSVDEVRRIYLIIRDRQGQAFWVLTPEGRLLVSYRLPGGLRAGSVPPLVDYRHQAYILADGRLFAISPEGKLLWEQTVSPAALGSIAANGVLVLANGSELDAVAPDGQRRTLHQFDEWLRAPAILTAQGELIAATEHRLYCLSPQTK